MNAFLSLSPDTLLFKKVVSMIENNNEYYYQTDDIDVKALSKKGLLTVFLLMILAMLEIFCKIYAVYLAWNVSKHQHTALRILNCMVAYWLGIFYLLIYKIAY